MGILTYAYTLVGELRMTVIITGANRGLGYETALALAADLCQTSVELSHLQTHESPLSEQPLAEQSA